MPSRIARVPSGLSGPDGTTAGSGSPRARCSARTDAGGYQAGFLRFETTRVVPSGVRQSILPTLTGKVMTIGFSPFFGLGK